MPKQITPEELASYAPSSSPLTADDLMIDHMSINYALKDKNPVDHVRRIATLA